MTLAAPALRPERAYRPGYCPECGSPGDESCSTTQVEQIVHQPEHLHAVRVA